MFRSGGHYEPRSVLSQSDDEDNTLCSQGIPLSAKVLPMMPC